MRSRFNARALMFCKEPCFRLSNRDSIAHLRIGFPNTINLAQPIANVTIEGFYNVPDSSPITLAIDRIVLRDTMLPANCTVASNAIGTIGIVSFCGMYQLNMFLQRRSRKTIPTHFRHDDDPRNACQERCRKCGIMCV